MKTAYGLGIPETFEKVCDPNRVALLVYDMQVGILSQVKNPEQITLQVLNVLIAARKAKVRVFFSRHLSPAKRANGDVSVPHGDGLATRGFAGTGESMVSARRSRISDLAGIAAASD